MFFIRFFLIYITIIILLLSGCSQKVSTIEEIQTSIKYQQKKLNFKEKLFSANNRFLAYDHDDLGYLYNLAGNYNLSLQHFQKALDIRIKSVGMKHKQTANNYNSIGFIFDKLGNFTKALENYEQALTINKQLKNDEYIAVNYNNIGLIYVQLGNFNTSLDYYEKALKIYEKLDQQKNISTAYNNMGFTYENMGFIENNEKLQFRAIKYYEKALKISDIFCKKDKNECGLSALYNSNLGFLYNRLSGYEEALEYSKKALTIQEKLFGKEHYKTAISYNNLGLIYVNMGINNPDDETEQKVLKYYEKALKYLESAITIREKVYGNTHQTTGISYFNIAKVYRALNKYEKSYQYIKKSFDIFMIDRDNHFSIMTNLQKLNYLKIRDNEISELLQATYLLNKKELNDKLIREMFNDWLNYKGSVFDIENTISMVYNKVNDKDIKSTIDQLNQKKRYLADLFKQHQLESKNRALLETTKNEIDKLEQYLSSKISIFQNELNLQDITTNNLTKVLKQNELYIDYVHTKNGYYIFTLDSKNNVTFEYINKELSEEMDTAIKTFKSSINNITNIKIQKELSVLYDLLIKNKIDNKQSLIISPDGLLNTIPFEAFFNKKNKKYLIESNIIRYIPSGKELIRLSQQKRSSENNKVITFANPNFNLNSTKSKLADLSLSQKRGNEINNWQKLLPFSTLSGTKREIFILKNIFQKNITIYTKDTATIDNLLNISNPTILHLATHGFFLKDKKIANPLLKAGLALSGANHAITNNSNGIILGLNLAGLNLEDTNLVVLSACETGVGDLNAAEGVSGLNKAFIMAGTKNIIMTLWNISDKHSADLIKKFYTNIQTKNYQKSLQKAKIEMIKEGLHPFFWSAFILNGL